MLGMTGFDHRGLYFGCSVRTAYALLYDTEEDGFDSTGPHVGLAALPGIYDTDMTGLDHLDRRMAA